MEQQAAKTTPVTRVVTILGIAALLGMIGYGVLVFLAPVKWREDSFRFASGATCIVFAEPKLIIFLRDGGDDEVFDRVNGSFHNAGFTVNNFLGYSSSSGKDLSRKTQGGKTTMQFLGGKGSLVVSHRGTKLTLADGREFILDGKTPLWLRCKTDGTIVQMDELPDGFVEFFESPPPDPGNIGEVTSYPEAFVK
jgi:hypothetical protein